MDARREAELIVRAREGSDDAFSQLVVAYQDRLYRFLMARARSREDAEDALQECFVNAYRYLASYDSRWRFSTWLYRIALRELGKCARQYDRRLDGLEPADTAPGPLAACIESDRQQNLWLVAREHLSEEAYTALWLRYAEDLSVRDVGHVVGRPVTWVKVVLHRARKKLAAKMAPENDDAPHARTPHELAG